MLTIASKKTKLIERCYDYLLAQFGRFSDANKIRVSLAITGKDIGNEGDAHPARVVNIINSYHIDRGAGESLRPAYMAERDLESPGTIQTDLLAPEKPKDNAGDKQADQRVLIREEPGVRLHSTNVQASQEHHLAGSPDVKAVPTERTFKEGSE